MNPFQGEKILYLIKTMDVGGSERFTLNLCQYFQKYFDQVIVYSSGGLFESELAKLGINHIKSINANKRDPVSLFKSRKEIKKIIRIYQPDILHCQHRIFLILLKSIRRKNFKIIYTANNYFRDFIQRLIYPDMAIAISPAIEKNLIDTTFIKHSKIKRINYGVRIEDLSKLENRKITLGYVGRIIIDKGILSIIESIEKLKNEGIFISLFIRGDGPGKKEVQKEILSRQLQNQIHIEGPFTDVDRLYQGINILILPSLLNEGLPLSILEAISRNILVVTTKSGGIEDIIEDRVTGFILKKNNSDELSAIIKFIFSHNDEVNNIKNNAFKILQEKYSIDKMLSGYHRIYEEVLNTI